MGRYICHYKGLYFAWSTVVDAPVTEAMTRAEFEAAYKEEHGRSGMEHLPARMLRAHVNGTSAFDETLESLVVGNHAGDDDEEISFREVLKSVGIPDELLPEEDI